MRGATPFYTRTDYADVRIVSAVGEYDPAKKGFIITFTIDEGAQYHVGTVDVITNVQALDPVTHAGRGQTERRNVYNADLVQKSVDGMTIEAAKHGYAFANVRHAVTATFRTRLSTLPLVEEGTRAYITSASISSAIRVTRDCDPPREFDLGVRAIPTTALLVDRAERRHQESETFQNGQDHNEPGSAPDGWS